MPEYVWCRCAPATYFGSSIYIYIYTYTILYIKIMMLFFNFIGEAYSKLPLIEKRQKLRLQERSCKILKNHCIIRAAASEKMLHWGWKHYSGTICTIFWTGKEKKIAIQSKQILNLPGFGRCSLLGWIYSSYGPRSMTSSKTSQATLGIPESHGFPWKMI